ncbi:MAG: hypothetical protein Q9222_000305 [Ikaeria aurantiellina]
MNFGHRPRGFGQRRGQGKVNIMTPEEMMAVSAEMEALARQPGHPLNKQILSKRMEPYEFIDLVLWHYTDCVQTGRVVLPLEDIRNIQAIPVTASADLVEDIGEDTVAMVAWVDAMVQFMLTDKGTRTVMVTIMKQLESARSDEQMRSGTRYI